MLWRRVVYPQDSGDKQALAERVVPPSGNKAARRGRYLRLLLGTHVEQRHEAEVAAQRFGVPGR